MQEARVDRHRANFAQLPRNAQMLLIISPRSTAVSAT